MLGNLLGEKDLVKKKRLLDNHTAMEMLGLFFEDWYSLREASIIYDPKILKVNNPKLSEDRRSHGVVSYYFYKFKEFGWLDEKTITKPMESTTKKGKKRKYPNTTIRYRLNYEPFFLAYYGSPAIYNMKVLAIKKKISPFLNKEKTRQIILKKRSYNGSKRVDRIATLSIIKFIVDKKFNPLGF